MAKKKSKRDLVREKMQEANKRIGSSSAGFLKLPPGDHYIVLKEFDFQEVYQVFVKNEDNVDVPITMTLDKAKNLELYKKVFETHGDLTQKHSYFFNAIPVTIKRNKSKKTAKIVWGEQTEILSAGVKIFTQLRAIELDDDFPNIDECILKIHRDGTKMEDTVYTVQPILPESIGCDAALPDDIPLDEIEDEVDLEVYKTPTAEAEVNKILGLDDTDDEDDIDEDDIDEDDIDEDDIDEDDIDEDDTDEDDTDDDDTDDDDYSEFSDADLKKELKSRGYSPADIKKAKNKKGWVTMLEEDDDLDDEDDEESDEDSGDEYDDMNLAQLRKAAKAEGHKVKGLDEDELKALLRDEEDEEDEEDEDDDDFDDEDDDDDDDLDLGDEIDLDDEDLDLDDEDDEDDDEPASKKKAPAKKPASKKPASKKKAPAKKPAPAKKKRPTKK